MVRVNTLLIYNVSCAPKSHFHQDFKVMILLILISVSAQKSIINREKVLSWSIVITLDKPWLILVMIVFIFKVWLDTFLWFCTNTFPCVLKFFFLLVCLYWYFWNKFYCPTSYERISCSEVFQQNHNNFFVMDCWISKLFVFLNELWK